MELPQIVAERNRKKNIHSDICEGEATPSTSSRSPADERDENIHSEAMKSGRSNLSDDESFKSVISYGDLRPDIVEGNVIYRIERGQDNTHILQSKQDVQDYDSESEDARLEVSDALRNQPKPPLPGFFRGSGEPVNSFGYSRGNNYSAFRTQPNSYTNPNPSYNAPTWQTRTRITEQDGQHYGGQRYGPQNYNQQQNYNQGGPRYGTHNYNVPVQHNKNMYNNHSPRMHANALSYIRRRQIMDYGLSQSYPASSYEHMNGNHKPFQTYDYMNQNVKFNSNNYNIKNYPANTGFNYNIPSPPYGPTYRYGHNTNYPRPTQHITHPSHKYNPYDNTEYDSNVQQFHNAQESDNVNTLSHLSQLQHLIDPNVVSPSTSTQQYASTPANNPKIFNEGNNNHFNTNNANVENTDEKDNKNSRNKTVDTTDEHLPSNRYTSTSPLGPSSSPSDVQRALDRVTKRSSPRYADRWKPFEIASSQQSSAAGSTANSISDFTSQQQNRNNDNFTTTTAALREDQMTNLQKAQGANLLALLHSAPTRYSNNF